MFSAAGTSGSFFWLVFFDLCMYARIYLYLLILSLSSTTYTYLLLFRSLFFDEPHDSSSFFSKPHSRQPHRVYTPFGAAAADASSHVQRMYSSLYFSEQIRAPCGCRA